MSTSKQIGILLFDDAEELDAIGPWEVPRLTSDKTSARSTMAM
jgi:hypothetical protein